MFAWNPAPVEDNCKGLRWDDHYSFNMLYVPADLDVDKIGWLKHFS